MKAYDKMFIGGEWREGRGEGMLENIDPMTGEVLYRYKPASREDVDDAYAAARAAQKEWMALTPADRVDALKRLHDVVVEYGPVIDEVDMIEDGAVLPKREFEKMTCAKIVEYCMSYPKAMDGKIQVSDTPGQVNYIYRLPRGVVCTIAPWNVPFVLAMRSVVPAVAAGNAVVLKPSSDSPASAFVVGEMFEKAGFPKGLVNCVVGKGSVIGDYIVQHPGADLISFTGSTEVGRRIGETAGSEIKEVSLELGGNNTMIVLPDANIDAAVGAAVFGKYFNSGQVCMAINRIILVGDIYDEFAEKFVAASKQLKVGSPKDPDTFIGPIINAGQVQHIEENIKATIAEGATVLLEGRTKGNLVWPWVFGDVTNDMSAAKNEVFGPVCSLMRAKDEDEAVAIANDTYYGLSNAVFSGAKWHGMEVAMRMESGMVHVNDQTIADEPHVMFGGEKQSGIGRFNGTWALDKFTTEKWISVR